MSLEDKIEALTKNVERLTTVSEALIGALAAHNPLAAAPAAEKPQAADNPLGGEPAAAAGSKGPGRPKTRYYQSGENGTVIKTSGDPLGEPWKEITKADYERLNTGNGGTSTKPAASAPPAADTATSTGPTLDDVREMGLKLRDATSMDIAKSFVAEFGVAKLADLPPEKFGEFIKKAQAKIDAASESEL